MVFTDDVKLTTTTTAMMPESSRAVTARLIEKFVWRQFTGREIRLQTT